MVNQKISALSALTKSTVATNDVLPIVDTSTATTKNITYGELMDVQDNNFRVSGSADNTKKVAFEVDGLTTGTTRTVTIPDASMTMVGTDTTQTLSNKILTSPKVNVGGDVTGDIYYRDGSGNLARLPIGSAGQVLDVSSGGIPEWIANPSTSDASTTVKGVVEEATSAEVTAGTSTGATGAKLFITPAALAASTPTFNASSLTSVTKIQQTTTPITQIVSSTAETTIYTVSVLGGTLGTSNSITLRAYTQTFNTSGASITTTYRLKYGATTVQTYVETTTNGNSTIGSTEFRLLANGSTSSQVSDMILNHVVSGLQVDGSGTASEDSTVTKNLVLTIQLNTSSANARFDSKNLVVTKVS